MSHINRLIGPVPGNTGPKTRFASRSRDGSRTRDSSRSRRSYRERPAEEDTRFVMCKRLSVLVSLRFTSTVDSHEGNLSHLIGQPRVNILGGGDGGVMSHVRPTSAHRTVKQISTHLPDRLDLDHRQLEIIPDLSGGYDEVLKLLNLQHNLIHSLHGIEILKRIVFLDLYDNKITDMQPLHPLTSLRVLMLGKNYIKRITGLDLMDKLDVLGMS